MYTAESPSRIIPCNDAHLPLADAACSDEPHAELAGGHAALHLPLAATACQTLAAVVRGNSIVDTTPLLCARSSPDLSTLMANEEESPPDSPAMPWRPGSSAYPPPAPIYPAPSISALTANECSDSDDEDSYFCCIRKGNQEFQQQLYNSLCEASYDLSLRDIVEPPFSIYGCKLALPATVRRPVGACNIVRPSVEADIKKELAASEVLRPINASGKCRHSCLKQERSQSCRKSDKCSCAMPSSPERKLAFSFSFPRSTSSTLHASHVERRTSAASTSNDLKVQVPTLPTQDQNTMRKVSLPKLAHVLSIPHETLKPVPSTTSMTSAADAAGSIYLPSSEYPISRPSFKRSYNDSASHRPLALPELKNLSGVSRKEYIRCRGVAFTGSSSARVHPSNQCSACAAYTIFFKSRCMVCGKLYCSNCARDAMDLVSDGVKRCKGECNACLRRKRLPKNLTSKCWALCGNVEVSKEPVTCKSVS